ncbi:hypothetical protein A9Z60_07825 [Moraxella nonliquefaciens]|uniref:Uncharacterized protein n=1 Tax=Moraxella nonliquefaciens TaxID=478 RepID=A0A1B8PK49_MORNO|nr:hypothetical protein A9Z60_07825 [Moraxella nonliquefaciens]
MYKAYIAILGKNLGKIGAKLGQKKDPLKEGQWVEEKVMMVINGDGKNFFKTKEIKNDKK